MRVRLNFGRQNGATLLKEETNQHNSCRHWKPNLVGPQKLSHNPGHIQFSCHGLCQEGEKGSCPRAWGNGTNLQHSVLMLEFEPNFTAESGPRGIIK